MSDGRLRAGRGHVVSASRAFDAELYEGERCAGTTDAAAPGGQEWCGRTISSLSSLLYDDAPRASTIRALGRRL